MSEIRLTGGEFDEVAGTYSGHILSREMIKVPVTINGEQVICTTAHLSHSKSWCICYTVESLVGFDGPVYVYGTATPDWVRWAQSTGLHWYGHRVTILDDPYAREFVLANKRVFVSDVSRDAAKMGANYLEGAK